MINPGKLFPDGSVQDVEGTSHALWDLRQKSHVVLFVGPRPDPQAIAEFHQAVQSTAKTWDWLRVVFRWRVETSADTPAGAYLIDRYGRFRRYFEPGAWTLSEIEQEWIYHEARFC